MYYEEPWDVSPSRVPHKRYLQTYLERKTKEGWRLERVLRHWDEPVPTISPRGLLRVYNFEVLLSRRLRHYTFEVPDRLVPRMLADPRIGPLIVKVS